MSKTETCRNIGDYNNWHIFHCSECGYYIGEIDDGNSEEGKYDKTDDIQFKEFLSLTEIRYCPHCGRKVKKEPKGAKNDTE